jgi:hypothetical protein
MNDWTDEEFADYCNWCSSYQGSEEKEDDYWEGCSEDEIFPEDYVD